MLSFVGIGVIMEKNKRAAKPPALCAGAFVACKEGGKIYVIRQKPGYARRIAGAFHGDCIAEAGYQPSYTSQYSQPSST